MNQANTKELLVEAAVELFVARGFHQVSTRSLAEKAGVNLGAIQYHFGSKEKLFIAAVHRVWGGESTQKFHSVFDEPLNTKTDAARMFGRFIASFLDDLLRPAGPQPCRMMFRELFAEGNEESEMSEELVTSVVEEFIRPVDSKLLDLLKKIFPDKSEEQYLYIANSVIGQCFFYMTHAAFLKRLRNIDYSETETIGETARHIISFTLAALPDSRELNNSACAAAAEFFVHTEEHNER